MRKFVLVFVLLVALSALRSVPSVAQNLLPTGTIPPSGTIPTTQITYLPFMALDVDSAPVVVAPLVGRYVVVPIGEQIQVFCRLGKPTPVIVADALIVKCGPPASTAP